MLFSPPQDFPGSRLLPSVGAKVRDWLARISLGVRVLWFPPVQLWTSMGLWATPPDTAQGWTTMMIIWCAVKTPDPWVLDIPGCPKQSTAQIVLFSAPMNLYLLYLWLGFGIAAATVTKVGQPKRPRETYCIHTCEKRPVPKRSAFLTALDAFQSSVLSSKWLHPYKTSSNYCMLLCSCCPVITLDKHHVHETLQKRIHAIQTK